MNIKTILHISFICIVFVTSLLFIVKTVEAKQYVSGSGITLAANDVENEQHRDNPTKSEKSSKDRLSTLFILIGMLIIVLVIRRNLSKKRKRNN